LPVNIDLHAFWWRFAHVKLKAKKLGLGCGLAVIFNVSSRKIGNGAGIVEVCMLSPMFGGE
jgi:hypothetical protein